MTTLERLAATSDPAWVEMIAQRRVQAGGDHAPLPVDWGRKGESHFKDGQFTKK